MPTIKLTVEYDGSGFSGWQVQPGHRTIQGELQRVLAQILRENIPVITASGRTDAGVHALAQVMKIEIPVFIPVQNIAKAINAHLPDDIRVIAAEISNIEFHPIYSAKSKEYNYVFTTEEVISPFARELMTHFPFDLDIELMRKGCQIFCGEHDFINYQCVGTDVESTVRKIISCELVRQESTGHWGNLAGEYYVLKVVGNGFLKQMVRLLMGALISLGKGKITLEDLEKSLKTPLKNRLGATAPPQGLYLKEVHY